LSSIAKWPARAARVAGLAALGALAWGSLVERNRFTIRHEFVPVLEPGSRDIRILHLTDAHLAPWQTAKQEWIRSLADLEPDLVVSTGDVLGHPDAIDAAEYALAPFGDFAGVYVNGSNDYFAPTFKNPVRYLLSASSESRTAKSLDTPRLERFFQDSLGWHNLNNAGALITVNGCDLELFGVNDAHRHWDDLRALPGLVEELQEAASHDSRSDTVSIGVTHAPYQRVLNAFVTNGAEVIFAGHTHGGQVRIPGLPPLVTNCDIPRDQAQGLSVWQHAQRSAFLNVSAGIGTSIYAPVRFACPPEAVLLTLTAGDFSYS
jgi:uncharacterized protein